MREDPSLRSVSIERIRGWGLGLLLLGVAMLLPCHWMGVLALELYDDGNLVNPTMLSLAALALGLGAVSMGVVGVRAVVTPLWLRTQYRAPVAVRTGR